MTTVPGSQQGRTAPTWLSSAAAINGQEVSEAAPIEFEAAADEHRHRPTLREPPCRKRRPGIQLSMNVKPEVAGRAPAQGETVKGGDDQVSVD